MKLSEEQERAVAHRRGHLRIMACPGSGKTEVLARRIAGLVGDGAAPTSIAAFTFTEGAAAELRGRIMSHLEEWPGMPDLGGMFAGTAGAFCLREIGRLRPEYRAYEVLDSARRAAFVDRWYQAIGLKGLRRGGARKWKTIRAFCESIDRLAWEGIPADRLSDGEFAGCYGRYLGKLKDERLFDRASVARALLYELDGDRAALARLNGAVKHVVVDEYQDADGLQERLLEHLSKGAESVCVVGDDDQSIFQWRGGDVRHILGFPEKYRRYGVATVKLETNYRATGGLIAAATRLISGNRARVPKIVRAGLEREGSGDGDIVHGHFDTDAAEFDYILRCISGLRGADFSDGRGGRFALSYGDMAVIVRTNEDAARIAGFLEERGVPCTADSGSAFERPLVRLAADCLLYAFGGEGYGSGGVPDPEELARRYAGILGPGGEGRFREGMRSVREAAEGMGVGKLPDQGLQWFYRMVLVAMGAEREALGDAAMHGLAVLSAAISDYEHVYRALGASQVAGLRWFLEETGSEYADPRGGDPALVDAVRILTIWKARGLEFPAVFVPSFVDRRRPAPRRCFVDDSLYDRGRYEGGDEDDRRAYYAAVTRSQKYLFLTGARRRTIVVRSKKSVNEILPHPFVGEMGGGEFAGPAVPPSRESGLAPRAGRAGMFPASFGSLGAYGRCPYEYKMRHVFGFSAGAPPASGYGASMRGILGRIHSEYARKGAVPTDREIGGMFGDMFRLRFAAGGAGAAARRRGRRLAKGYAELLGGGSVGALDAGRRFEFPLGGALVTGSIDLLDADGGTEAVDLAGDGGDGADLGELARFYACAAGGPPGRRPAVAAVRRLDGKRDEVDVGSAALERTRRGISEKVGRILSLDFGAAPGDAKCGECDFKALCRHKGFEVGVGAGPGRPPKGPRAGDGRRPKKPEPTRETIEKARRLADDPRTARNADGSYAVPSSGPGRAHTATASKCDCRGFLTYHRRRPLSEPTCSHVEAVKILEGRRAARGSG